ncbi:galactokinase [Coemansia aciculifera]|uniref:Galactokinase n=1 Tax=Coemansia aciculifera TaxID=417176 RepID=A0A9W8IKU8_9FUNG|nr:galactokinase [Coemansia aciculifera]
MDHSIPIVSALDDVYAGNLLQHGARYQALTEAFIETYGAMPDFIARAPGRVNIIGEHIDYCGFPVFPMAIVPDCLIAVKAVDGSSVKLSNVNAKFAARQFAYQSGTIVDIDQSVHDWVNYFKCGYRGALEAIANTSSPVGMQCLMDGSVPISVGLSSSSAFVCCAVMATMKANGKLLSQERVVETSVASERYIGTNGGGMDQTTSIMSQPQSAAFIEFSPMLRVTPVRFPNTTPPIAFVIANTMVESDKAVTAPTNYNLRVVETRIGALMLAKHLNISEHSACANADPLTFKTVMDEYFASSYPGDRDPPVLKWTKRLTAILERAEALFATHPQGFTLDECAEYLSISANNLMKLVHTDRFPVRTDRFKLLQRAQHAFSEALRVVKFRQVCESGDTSDECFVALGALMNQSQDSCRDLFECSCPELDEVCKLARKAGSFGSRLTGAGWGGCSVHLVRQDSCDNFIATLKQEYYSKHFPELADDELKNAIFATSPSSGAAIYAFD